MLSVSCAMASKVHVNQPSGPIGTEEYRQGEILLLPPLPPLPKGAPDHGTFAPLPAKRRSSTYEARLGGLKLFVTCGEYDDGRLGEISIDVAKEGSSVRGLLSCFAVLFSTALQHGTKLSDLVDRFLHVHFPPAGAVEGHPSIRYATSLVDYVAQLVAVEYLGREDLAKKGPTPIQEGHE